jgi:nitrogen regulatory protein P-II 1
MKLIIAIIRPDKLEAVREALLESEITRITVSRVSGHGRAEREKIFRGQKIIPTLTSKVRMEIACNDEYVDTTVNAILKHAKDGEGRLGDGKIFITHLEECIRIRTGERGGKAI